MARISRLIWIAVLVLSAGVVFAGDQKADRKSVQELMNKSGLNNQLEQIAPMIQAGMAEANQEAKAVPPEAMRKMNDMAAKAFEPKVMKATVEKHIQAGLLEDDAKAALEWLNSSLGRKITKMEEKATTPEAFEEMQQSAEKLSKDSGRVGLVRKLDAAVRTTDTSVAVAMNAQIATVAALTSQAPAAERPTMEDLENGIAKYEEQIRNNLEQVTILTFLYTYKDLSDAELKKYIDFAGSASGRKYHAATAAAVTAAMKDASRAMGELIAKNAGGK